ncbi:MAG TPA: class I SAM-dependent methyltransferase [Actinospica sp.]|jgi:SAM-dependent methyltransferase|nr:class I SAM-dependent methyltransferase [Actinospica sp.]
MIVNQDGRPLVQAAYARGRETGRLDQQRNRIEAERTKNLIAQRLPAPGAVVLDVGGGPGYYAAWLRDRGYRVVLADVVEIHARQAAEHAIPALVADATALPLLPGRADALLLLGPLYHLVNPADRARALTETYRELRPGGILFAAALSRWAKPATRAADGQPHTPDDARHLAAIMTHGHDAHGGDWHACTYHHTPAELAAEIEHARFSRPDVLGIEGPLGALARRDPNLTDTALHLAAEAQRDAPALSIHILAIATKPATA